MKAEKRKLADCARYAREGGGGTSEELRLVSFGVFMSLSYSVFCSLLCRACEVHSEGVSTHYLRALERTRYDRTNHLT